MPQKWPLTVVPPLMVPLALVIQTLPVSWLLMSSTSTLVCAFSGSPGAGRNTLLALMLIACATVPFIAISRRGLGPANTNTSEFHGIACVPPPSTSTVLSAWTNRARLWSRLSPNVKSVVSRLTSFSFTPWTRRGDA